MGSVTMVCGSSHPVTCGILAPYWRIRQTKFVTVYVSLWDDKNALELDKGDNCIIIFVLNGTELYLKIVNFMLCELYFN